ncbi:MAG: metal ABC transporter permease [Chloroflexota bacterium]
MTGIFQYEFMRNALIAGGLAAVSCGIIGAYVVVKKMVAISGSISHASFGGIGLGYFLGINPIVGALFFAVAAALGMGLMTRRTRLPEDTTMGIMWAVGMAAGIIFIGLTPGYAPDLFSYLFGSILTVPTSDLVMMLLLDMVIILMVSLLYKELLALSFDEEFSTVIGIPTEALYLTLLCLIALTIVVLIRVVGVILVIALLTIPAATARQFTRSLRMLMILSFIFGALFTFTGLVLSYLFDMASGATIILVSAALFAICYGVSMILRRRRQRIVITTP